ncbi:protein-L-isoaspartate(D-aspartate) O-methyltransferase, partial [Nocardiopsis sp. frass4]
LAFMWSRSQRSPARSLPGPDARPDRVEHVDTDPREARLDGETAVLLSLLTPAWSFGMGMEPGADQPHVRVSSASCESWLRLHADGRVESSGPRPLWREFTGGLSWWHTQGSPEVSEFGLTVDRDRALQTVWLRSLDTTVWTTHRNRA